MIASYVRLRRRHPFNYTYDFGDDWRHSITVEAVTDADPAVEYPRFNDRIAKIARRRTLRKIGYAKSQNNRH